MNSLKKSMRLAKIFAFALSFLMFCFPTAAMAQSSEFLDAVQQCVDVTNGEFSVDKAGIVSEPIIIREAIVSLKKGGTGTVDNILIIDQEGDTEFSCKNIKVQEGTDLIPECGGPAYLKAGLTTYEAKGSGFIPPDNQFCIELDTVDG